MGIIQFKGGTIQFKGGTIQLKNLGKVANPTVVARWAFVSNPWKRNVEVTNNDTETVEVWVGTVAKENLMTQVGSLAGGASDEFTVSEMLIQPANGATFTAYVQVRVTGRPSSDVVSDVSGGFIPVFEG